jgi:hypothetical protein
VKVTFNNVTYNTQNWINQYDEFAPIGDSYGGGNLDAHLHLNLYYNVINTTTNKITNTIQSDPWCEVEHVKTYFDEEIIFNENVPQNPILQSLPLNSVLKYWHLSFSLKSSLHFFYGQENKLSDQNEYEFI